MCAPLKVYGFVVYVFDFMKKILIFKISICLYFLYMYIAKVRL